jgi:hypothetical protein
MLAHVFRNNLTLRTVLHRLFYTDGTLSAVSRRTASLVARGFLNRHVLFGKRIYFTAGQRAVRRFRLARNAARAIPKQRLPLELGSLAFCCGGEIVRKRLTAAELRSEFKWLPDWLVDSNVFYFDFDGDYRRLGWLRVEISGSPSYIVEKHQSDLYDLQQIRQFRQLIEEDELMIVTVTTSPERRIELVRELSGQRWYPKTRVVDYPDLANFI